MLLNMGFLGLLLWFIYINDRQLTLTLRIFLEFQRQEIIITIPSNALLLEDVRTCMI